MKKSLFALIFLFPFIGWSQEISVIGNVTDVVRGKLLKSKIVYRSYPTGSISGTINDSTFTFGIFGSSKYQVTAEAEGYMPRTIIVDPKEAVGNIIKRNIELTSLNSTIVLDHLIFELGKAVINSKSYPELDEVVAMMKENTKIVIQLEGHTDNKGNADANLKLSQSRVDAVKKYITSKGIGKDRVKTKAFGGTQPIATENTEEARALNRRVEMRVLKD
ncbi:MAG: OmpA family protein [Cyclobacteriaceae bacterium]|jgi:OmpA-OmpF porin, OOP family|nr:OmpA family protein [Cyclobacteriaceae bacterium]